MACLAPSAHKLSDPSTVSDVVILDAMRRLCRLPLLAVLLGATAPAFAQEDGIFVDPDTPAGKEYAIPLEQARQEAVGETRDARVSGGSTLASAGGLFGEGIRRARGGDFRRGAASGGGGRAGQVHSTRDALAAPSSAALVRQTSSGGSNTLPTLAIPLGVLLVGGAIALAVIGRRRMRRPPSH
jgi:hypothetical protein